MPLIDKQHGIELISRTLTDGSKVFSIFIPKTSLEMMSEENAIIVFQEISFQFSQAVEIRQKPLI